MITFTLIIMSHYRPVINPLVRWNFLIKLFVLFIQHIYGRGIRGSIMGHRNSYLIWDSKVFLLTSFHIGKCSLYKYALTFFQKIIQKLFKIFLDYFLPLKESLNIF